MAGDNILGINGFHHSRRPCRIIWAGTPHGGHQTAGMTKTGTGRQLWAITIVPLSWHRVHDVTLALGAP
jgi:hypothetical protein